MFGYEYVSFSPEQVEARRKLLDEAGYRAYLAPLILLVTIYAGRQLLPALGSKQPKSSLSRDVRWVLTNTYIPEFGPLHVQLTGIAYAAFLVYVAVSNTGNDYMHVTKAFGHVAVSQLPFHYLLAVKDARSPVTLATGLTYERLNNYHRLFGRIVHAMLAVHAILYLRFFIEKDLLQKRKQDWDVRFGLMAFASVNLLGLFSIPIIRKAMYHKVFYRSHVILSGVLLVVLWMHVPYTRIYVGQAGLAWILNGVSRRASSASVTLNCKKVSNGLIEVTAKLRSASWDNWVPGMHGYLNQNGLGPKNPFTIVDVTKGKDHNVEVKFIIRDLGGPTTGLLSKEADGKKKSTFRLEGPYGESQLYMPELLDAGVDAGKTLIVAGGVGASYSLPIYMAFLKAWKGQTNNVRLVWIVKDLDDARWGLQMLSATQEAVNVHLYVRKPESTSGDDSNADIDIKGLQLHHSSMRPDMKSVLGHFLAAGNDNGHAKTKGKLTVMVCGPPSLSESLREAVGLYVKENVREVAWYEEQFGLGGS